MLLADVGVPMIFVELPVMAIALIPIVLVEACIYVRTVGVSWPLAWRGSMWANLLSTFVGIPIAWFVQLLAQGFLGGGSAWGMDSPLLRLAAITVQSAWLIPYEKELHWMVPAAAMFFLIPCLIVSIVVELRLLRWYWRKPVLRTYWHDIGPRTLTYEVVLANLASYALLAGFWAIQLCVALR
jgi:hypothetical protein